MKTAAVIQSRQTSSRLPGKALINIGGKPVLQRVIERCRAAKSLNDVIVATTTNEADNAIVELCERLNCHCYRGSEDNVMLRVLEAAKAFNIDVICEITADCPFIFWEHIDTLVNWHLSNDADITSNIIERTYPRGFDIRVFYTKTLEKAYSEVDNSVDKEHVSTWLYLNPESSKNYTWANLKAPSNENRPDLEVTLDTPEDLELIRFLYGFENQGYNMALTCAEVINLIDTYPMMYNKVEKVKRKNYFEELDNVTKSKTQEKLEEPGTTTIQSVTDIKPEAESSQESTPEFIPYPKKEPKTNLKSMQKTTQKKGQTNAKRGRTKKQV